MFTVRVNDSVFKIERNGDGFIVNGKAISWDATAIREGYFHILMDNVSYRAEIVQADAARKRLTIKVNGQRYPVVLMDRFDLLLEQMGMSANAGTRFNLVRAPMPGLIIDLKVKEGDRVAAGDPLLILEAMKMENIIKAPGDAIVKSITVRMGEGVEKNQVLIEFNPA